MIDYRKIKEMVTAREYAESIGYNVTGNGMIRCPFHDDRTPSMKVDERYHCFGCGADGDVINFVAGLNGISNSDAARRIMTEFNLDCDDCMTGSRPPPKARPISARDWKNVNMSYLIKIEKELESWLEEYRPETDADRLHPLFVTALHNIEYVSYLIDCLAGCKTEDEIFDFKNKHKGEIKI